MSARYEPKLRELSVSRPDPVFSQEIHWSFGPAISDHAGLSVSATGKHVSIRERGTEVLSMPLDRARLLHEALGNVIKAAIAEAGDPQ